MKKNIILELKNISKYFGGIQAINNISIQISKKQIFGLIGPNGAGKTTLFNIITGDYKPTSGEVWLDNKNITNMKNYKIVRCGIARTFQNIRLFSSMSVLDNLLIGMDNEIKYTYFESIFRLPRYFKAEKQSKQLALNILDKLELLQFKNELATSLSYGIQRK